MRKNNEGFMLAEAIITTAVIATAMVSLYSIFNRIYNQFNKNNNYYNIDGMYAIINTVDYLLDSNQFNDTINRIFDSGNYGTIIKFDNDTDNDICFHNTVVCKAIRDNYNINQMIIAEYDATILTNVKEKVTNQTFKEYIDYIIGYYGVSNDDTRYSYIVLAEIKDGNNYYYANLGIE